MIDKVKKTIEEHNMIKKGDNIVIGVSGGIDSMALLYSLYELRDVYDISIHVAHVNHGVRGEEARRDQDFVESVASKLGLRFWTSNVDMNAYGKKHKISAEEAGRILRYGFFNDIIDRLGHGKIAVGHNLNDQAETLIMRFFRGTGLEGLKGIDYKVDNVIRPILGVKRDELEEYIRDRDIDTVLDGTNLESIYTRNKVRLELIPYIEENFNPNLIETMERTSNLARIENSFLDGYSREKYLELKIKQDKSMVVLDSKKYKKLDLCIKQRVLRHALLDIEGNLQGISEIHISNLIDLFDSGETGKSINGPNNLIGLINYDELIVKKEKKGVKSDYELVLEDGLSMEGYSFELSVLDIKDLDGFPKSKNVRYFDYDKISGPLIIRNRRPGDRFVPFGMKGEKKIKDYFIDEKIPRFERDSIPILCDDNNILWVIGYRTSEIYKVTKDTKKVISIGYNII